MFKLKENFALLGEAFYSVVSPIPLDNSQLVHLNHPLIDTLGLNEVDQKEWNSILSGNHTFPDYQPLASVYAGHQFGVPVPRLGDGRAMLIFEHEDSEGKVWELQLKGAGLTPYSRMGDGRAVLRSTIREYVASIAMAALNIPTTLAIGMCNSDTKVYREEVESGAVILRVSRSFIRFGHFEYFAKQKKLDELKQLINFTVTNYYPEIEFGSSNYILSFLDAVVKKTADMIANWQAVGFVHGVMNTDNMSILGLTIDYGPYVFMDKSIPSQIYNHSDSEGRYTYANQVYIGWWNLYRLAESLVLIYPDADRLEECLSNYADYYNVRYTELIGKKLGFEVFEPTDFGFAEKLLKLMQQYQMDWTYSWRQLGYGESGYDKLKELYHLGEDFSSWYSGWQQALVDNKIDLANAFKLMQENNPAIVPRNHLLQEAIAKAQGGSYLELTQLIDALRSPYQEIEQYQDYYKLPPAWAEHIHLSCSS